jgi:16S rRNA (adenine1518-N6/adenine1519-N6)-dimethyltransferase
MRAFPRDRPDPPRARRRLGQHFLADRGAVRTIVAALRPSPEEPVLEIGPGRGALTGDLVGAAGRIAAVELDPRLAAGLRARFRDACLVLFERDVLELDLLEVAPALGFPRTTPLAVVGNLPYGISKPVAAKLVAERETVSRAVLMFQREVASRLVAAPGTKDYGPLTVLVGRAYRVEALFHLRPSSFRPRPRVDSTVTRWERLPAAELSPAIEPALRATLSACFAHRRQTILNNLRAALPGGAEEARALLERAALDPGLRAEAVPPEAFLGLAAVWPSHAKHRRS